MRTPTRIAAVHLPGVWALYRWSVVRILRFGLEALAGPVLSSLLFLAVFSVALGGTQIMDSGVTFTQFLVPGLALFALANTAFANAAFPLVHDKLQGAIQDFQACPLAGWELGAVYTLTGATAGLFVGGLTLLAASLFVPLPMASPLLLLGFGLGTALIFGSLGSIAGLWAEKWDQLAVINTFLMLPLAFLSGAFFSRDTLPQIGQTLLAFNPVYYLIDGARSSALGTTGAPLLLASGVLMVLLALGLGAVWRLFTLGYKIKA